MFGTFFLEALLHVMETLDGSLRADTKKYFFKKTNQQIYFFLNFVLALC
jgi:hypothetical protein